LYNLDELPSLKG